MNDILDPETLARLKSEPGRDFGHLIKQLHQMLNAAIEARMRAAGVELTFPRAVALMSLIERPGLSNAEMAREAMVSPQTMHQILRKLLEEGLVTRRADPVHRRVQRTEITTAGQALLLRGIEVADAVLGDVQRGLSAEERSQLTRLLGVCRDNLVHAGRSAKAAAR